MIHPAKQPSNGALRRRRQGADVHARTIGRYVAVRRVFWALVGGTIERSDSTLAYADLGVWRMHHPLLLEGPLNAADSNK